MKKFPRKILIIRLGAIGDVLHTSQIASSFKKHDPSCTIHYMTGKIPSKLLEFDKNIDKVIIFEKKDYGSILKNAKVLRNERYDLIVNLQPSLKIRLLSFLAFPGKILNYKKNPFIHAVRNFFDTAGQVYPELIYEEKLHIEIPENIKEKVKSKLPEGDFVVIAPMAGPVREGKRWRSEYFKKLALDLIEKYDISIVISGAPDEKGFLKDFENLHEKIYLKAGEFDIMESAALFSLAKIVIGADTGPLHIASATQNPVCIALYGAMAVYRTGLVGKRVYNVKSDKLSCIPCRARYCKIHKGVYSPCMDEITPEMIEEIIARENILISKH